MHQQKIIINFLRRYIKLTGAEPNENNLLNNSDRNLTKIIKFKEATCLDLTKLFDEISRNNIAKLNSGKFNQNHHLFKEKSEQLLYLFLSRAYFIRPDQILPFLMCYYELNLDSKLTEKSWLIIGRILNNGMNNLLLHELLAICYYLCELDSKIFPNEEFNVFWQRIEIQLENFINQLDDFNLNELGWLLHMCYQRNFDSAIIGGIYKHLLDNKELFHQLDELDNLFRILLRNNVFNLDIFLAAMEEINTIVVEEYNSEGLTNLLYSLSNYCLKYPEVFQFYDKFPEFQPEEFEQLSVKMKLKLAKSLYVLNHNCQIIKLPNTLHLEQFDNQFEVDFIDCFLTNKLLSNPSDFFQKYSQSDFLMIRLPNTLKYMLYKANCPSEVKYLDSEAFARQYIERIQSIQRKSPCDMNPNSTEQLLIVNKPCFKGVIPCNRLEQCFPSIIDSFQNYLQITHQIKFEILDLNDI